MLIDIKNRIDDPAIVELIEYSVFPDPDRLAQILNEYKTNADLELLAYEDDGEIIGIIGFKLTNQTLEIRHMAIEPYYRGKGYGRGQLLELIELKNPEQIIAETDEESVEFYRNVGFSIHSLGEKYPGVERFKCVYQVNSRD